MDVYFWNFGNVVDSFGSIWLLSALGPDKYFPDIQFLNINNMVPKNSQNFDDENLGTTFVLDASFN